MCYGSEISFSTRRFRTRRIFESTARKAVDSLSSTVSVNPNASQKNIRT